jgi:hypothetical protein
MDDPIRVLAAVKKASKSNELYHATTYAGYRENARGQTHAVTIEIWDMGPDKPNLRYSVMAVDDEGRRATGNPDEAIEGALLNVHWQELDREDVPHADDRPYRPHI